MNSNQQITRWCHLLVNHLFWWQDSTCIDAVTVSKQSFFNLENLHIVPTLVLILKVTFPITKKDFGYCWEVIYSSHCLPHHWNPERSTNVTFIKSLEPSLQPKSTVHSCALWKLAILCLLLACMSLCLVWLLFHVVSSLDNGLWESRGMPSVLPHKLVSWVAVSNCPWNIH